MEHTTSLIPYKVVFLAPAAAVFREEQGFKLDIQGESTGVDLRIRTRFDAMPVGAPIPREIWLEANLLANSLDHAVDEGRQAASWIIPLLAFVTNAEVGDPSLNLAFDASERAERREFIQLHLAEARTLPGRGRLVEVGHLQAVVDAIGAESEPGRIWRALAQYGFALRNWSLGSEFLALMHLWMAVEALLKLAIEDFCQGQSKTLEELAEERNIDMSKTSWKSVLSGQLRLETIFQGDQLTHQLAKRASDGLEHGFEEAPQVQRNAIEVCDRVFGYVRAAIVLHLGIEEPLASAMLSKDPIDTRSSRKLVHCFLRGDVTSDQLAASEQQYPRFVWSTSIQEVVEEEDHFSIRLKEDLTGQFGDGVSAEEIRFSAYWRPTSHEISEAAERHEDH